MFARPPYIMDEEPPGFSQHPVSISLPRNAAMPLPFRSLISLIPFPSVCFACKCLLPLLWLRFEDNYGVVNFILN